MPIRLLLAAIILAVGCSNGVMNAETLGGDDDMAIVVGPEGDFGSIGPGPSPTIRPPTTTLPPSGEDMVVIVPPVGDEDMGGDPPAVVDEDMATRPPPTSEACDQATAWCDDFESGSLDAARYREVNFGPSAVTMSQDRAHSGDWSVRVDGDNFTQMLAVNVPAPRFFVRVYLNSDTAMNMGHNTYINATEGNGDPNQGEAIRVGEHRSQLEINRKSDDREILSSGDYNSLDGATQFEPDRWYCLEVLFDGPGSQVKVWVDGAPVEKLEADWTANYQTFKFGYEKYHGPNKTLWYDDLALAETRIGCQ